MIEPKTREQIQEERQRIDEEYEKYVDENGNSEDIGAWRQAAHDELDENN